MATAVSDPFTDVTSLTRPSPWPGIVITTFGGMASAAGAGVPEDPTTAIMTASLDRSSSSRSFEGAVELPDAGTALWSRADTMPQAPTPPTTRSAAATSSEEHTSELQSRKHLECRLRLEKKKKNTNRTLRRKNKTKQKKNTRKHRIE